jgi:hypothetical protein
MGSMRLEGVRFCVYSNDHHPRHVHALIGRTRVIIELTPDGEIRIAKRTNPIRPRNAKKSDVSKALALAAEHFEGLIELWEKVHGTAQNPDDR